jgi:hypothetical protein
MADEPIIDAIKRKYTRLCTALDERSRRFWAATEASARGSGGMVAVAQATGLRERTMRRGSQDLQPLTSAREPSPGRMRRRGGGRQPWQAHAPARMAAREALVAPTTRGEPRSPLRWTCQRTRPLAQALRRPGHPSSPPPGAPLVPARGDRVPGTRKTQAGRPQPARDAPLPSIQQQGQAFHKASPPGISVDATKTECVGDGALPGRA